MDRRSSLHEGFAGVESAWATDQDTVERSCCVRLRQIRRSPLAEDDADGGFVEDREFECAPGLLLDGVAVWMEHTRASRLDFIVEFVNVVGFDGDLWAVFGGIFGTGDDVGLCAIAIDDGEFLVAITDLETETVDEEVEAFFEGVIEDFWDQAEHHGGIGTRPRTFAERKVTGSKRLFLAVVVAGFAAGFLFELDGADDDGFVERLGHVVDGEGGDGGGGEGFHLDAGLRGGGSGGADADSVLYDGGFDVDVSERERVAHGDELGSSLGGLDSGEAGDFKGIAFWIPGQRIEDGWGEFDEGRGGGYAAG